MDRFPLIIVLLSFFVLAIAFPVSNIQTESYTVSWDFWFIDDIINLFAQFVSFTITVIKYIFTVSYYVMKESPSIFKIPLIAVFSIILLTALSVLISIWKASNTI